MSRTTREINRITTTIISMSIRLLFYALVFFLLYEGMKKFPEVEEYFKEFNKKKSRLLYGILERGQKRGEIHKSIDLENYVTMILAMQDGILALRVLDETIDEEEKYTKIQYQMWKEISTAKMQNYEDGGVTSAVS